MNTNILQPIIDSLNSRIAQLEAENDALSEKNQALVDALHDAKGEIAAVLGWKDHASDQAESISLVLSLFAKHMRSLGLVPVKTSKE